MQQTMSSSHVSSTNILLTRILVRWTKVAFLQRPKKFDSKWISMATVFTMARLKRLLTDDEKNFIKTFVVTFYRSQRCAIILQATKNIHEAVKIASGNFGGPKRWSASKKSLFIDFMRNVKASMEIAEKFEKKTPPSLADYCAWLMF